MARLKSAVHHWWPRCVSRWWADPHGMVTRLSPDGATKRAPPGKFGGIGNAHSIKLSRTGRESTVWDECFEQAFDVADSNFPELIGWLSGLERIPKRKGSSVRERLHPVGVSDERLRMLVECLVSLAVRSPMNREAAVSLAERFRGPLHGNERNAIIGLNMRNCQRMVADSIGSRGKFVVLYSPDREFIFGDGFFHNISSPSMAPIAPRILAPVTPEMSVLHAVPTQYGVEPRLMTLVLDGAESVFFNDTVQIYARRELFFRSQQPRIIEEFKQATHRCYEHNDHPIECLVHDIPGVTPSSLWPHWLGVQPSTDGLHG